MPEQAAERPSDTPRWAIGAERLTGREAQILGLIGAGMSNRAVAEALFVSPRTVERHIANIYRKIHAHNRAEAATYAFARDLD